MISIYESFHRQLRIDSVWTQKPMNSSSRSHIIQVKIIDVQEKFIDVMEVGKTTRMIKKSLGVFVTFIPVGMLSGNREIKLDGFLSEYRM